MNATQVLLQARDIGLVLNAAGEDLYWESDVAPPAELLASLAQHKTEILDFIRREEARWREHDWQALFDERAAIIEHDAGKSRDEAEKQAFAYCVVEWVNRHPARSPPGQCALCGEGSRSGEPLVPYGTPNSAWLHQSCAPSWWAARTAQAEAALRASITVTRASDMSR